MQFNKLTQNSLCLHFRLPATGLLAQKVDVWTQASITRSLLLMFTNTCIKLSTNCELAKFTNLIPLSVCLLVTRISEKLINEFEPNFEE